MNKILSFFFTISIITLVACSEEGKQVEEEQSQQEKTSEEGEKTEEQDTGTPGGEFQSVAHKEDIDTVEVGPLTLTIVSSNLVTGTVTDPFILDKIGEENIDYINIGMEISTTDEDINFSSDHLKLTTDTGESFESPHDFMSDKVEMQYIKEDFTRSRMIVYLFDNSKVEDIKSANLLIKAPTDQDGQPLGEDANVEIDFEEK
ncbi:hypothetical protein [Halobacillus litoralis]|uniref:hypothetical protein n=1 Tax=Halobacillus litoralis TaxID=45668 RepID=UPI00136EB379|nr:hypothetical protein [Halobacillus litoralis]MYL39838.1 hypothetical protein [Halobacillus litoralis]